MTEVMPTRPAKKRGGRPPKANPGDVRTHQINVRLTEAEHSILCERAKQNGKRPADFLRTAALTRRLPSPPVPEVNRLEYARLARLAANLNQAMKAINEGRISSIENVDFAELQSEVSRLRLALIAAGGDGK